jgi:ubiquinone/menaquinone biosynthesis C-methylase UbiE
VAFSTLPRRPSTEILDRGGLAFQEIEGSLRDIARAHRIGGGLAAVRRFLLPEIGRAGRSGVRVLDVGSGSGAVLADLARCARGRKIALSTVALDLRYEHLRAGRRIVPGPDPAHAVAGDARQLPFATDSFDWVVMTLLFHHFEPEANRQVLQELARVARRGFLILDLRRHRLFLFVVSALKRLLFRSETSRQDGPASIRQAYTLGEARRIVADAEVGAAVFRVFPFWLAIASAGRSARNAP